MYFASFGVAAVLLLATATYAHAAGAASPAGKGGQDLSATQDTPTGRVPDPPGDRSAETLGQDAGQTGPQKDRAPGSRSEEALEGLKDQGQAKPSE